MNLEKQKAFIIHVVYITFILGLGYIGIKYLLPLLMPFVIGIIIAVTFRRLIDLLEKKLHIKRSIVAILVLIIFYAIVSLLVSMIGVKIFTFLQDLFGRLPKLYDKNIGPAFRRAADNLILQYPGIEEYLKNFIVEINNTIFSFVSDASSSVIGMITGLAGQIPSILIKLIFTIVSSFFFTVDYYRITDFAIRQFKGERREMILRLKDNGIGTLGKFFRAYAAIISITFLELSIGFWILGIPSPFLFGALIAVIDVLPILGTGAVLLPWSVISFLMGNTKIGFGILILYIIITVVRQAIEPKIVGQQIGLHPVLTLVLMFVGVQLMGILGLLLLPIIATIIKKLNDEGTIHLFS
ncbi:sporulation integral membrane protein YtvI [Mobilitalea sibirica]|uniref:Sporulation integral membrane protein YtvI n=1 Tax=Mobilitalea sibirica TaxID=1462919 RepID=A0A8J7H185_9FIRM|nr:sporulation integral membrane protein YtvI [Mobilitalea sibirica]MBH1940052.1 sporulation integral membrane protein YtvI [Mobilitalea sibirica]